MNLCKVKMYLNIIKRFIFDYNGLINQLGDGRYILNKKFKKVYNIIDLYYYRDKV